MNTITTSDPIDYTNAELAHFKQRTAELIMETKGWATPPSALFPRWRVDISLVYMESSSRSVIATVRPDRNEIILSWKLGGGTYPLYPKGS